ncbi:MAG: hypothetical protein AAB284_02550, partial [Chloroflexota bacterium]
MPPEDELNDFRLSPKVRPSRYELRFDLDLDAWRFEGRGRIAISLDRAARDVTLHALDLDIAVARMDGEPATRVSYDEGSQTATLEFASELAAGEHVMELEWTGEIRGSLRGLYRSTRPGERYAATQYAFLSALYGLSRAVAGGFSGYAAESLGFGAYFAATFVLALPAFALLPA